MTKVIKACFVKQHLVNQNPIRKKEKALPASAPSSAPDAGQNKTTEEFTRETSTAIYLETKAIVNELIMEAEKKATAILGEAQSKADQLLQQAQQEREELLKKAQEEGFQKGYQESIEKAEEEIAVYKAQTLDLLNSLSVLKKNYLAEQADDILDLIMLITKKMLNVAIEYKPEVIASIVKKVLEETSEAESITIKVNPIHMPFLDFTNENILDLVKNKFTVEPDSGIKPGDCIVVTEKGFIDAQIDEQMQYLKKVIKEEWMNV